MTFGNQESRALLPHQQHQRETTGTPNSRDRGDSSGMILKRLVAKVILVTALAKALHVVAVGSLDYYHRGTSVECSTANKTVFGIDISGGSGSTPAQGLANDCLRLGLVWPLANLALSCALFAYLLLTPWETGHSLAHLRSIRASASRAGAASGGGALAFHDNRLAVAWATTITSAIGATNALFFILPSLGPDTPKAKLHEQLYWQSQLVFWLVALVACGRQALGFRGNDSRDPLFHWSLVLVMLAQCVLSVPMESYFSFFTGEHIHEGIWATRHSRFVLVAAAIAALTALLPLTAHRRGFLLPKGQRKAPTDALSHAPEVSAAEEDDCGADARNSGGWEYETSLSRMRAEQIPLVESPETDSSILDRLVFGWVTPVLRLGTKTTIDSGDLYLLKPSDRPMSVWRRYTGCRKPGRSLLRTLMVTFLPQLAAQVLLALAGAVLSYAGPFFLQRILRSIRLYGKHGGTNGLGSGSSVGGGAGQGVGRLIFLDAFGLLLSSLLHSFTSNQVLWLGRKVSLRLQSLLVAELSSKALQRRCKTSGVAAEEKSAKSGQGDEDEEDKTASSDGRIANMLTSDLESVGHISSYLDEIYTLPIGFCLGSWYLYSLMGIPALIGLAITVIYYPLTKIMVKYLIKYHRRLMALDDERVTMITEMFQGIRAVKLFGWQSRFVEKVRAKREEQLSAFWKLIFLQLPVSFVRSVTTSMILVAILAIYTLVFKNTLTADIVFPTITVFSMVSATFNRIPGLFGWVSSCYVSLTRIESFMEQAHIQDLAERVADTSSDDESILLPGQKDAIVGFVNASMVWSVDKCAGDVGSVNATAVPTVAASVESSSVNQEAMSEISEESPLLANKAGGHRKSYSAITSSSLDDIQGDGVCGEDADMISPSTTVGPSLSPISGADVLPKDPAASASTDGAAMAPVASFGLENITLLFPRGKLSIVVGPTGSGKSSLLSALIGEMTLTSGRIILPTADPLSIEAQLESGKYREVMELAHQGRVMTDVAYVSQEAWLRNATIRENILFGQPYNQERYEEVLRACALKPDLRILTAGDKTEIGERGVTLSGGQKQRVALARAVYSDRQILLIDDCLSAVDAHTGKHILNQCLVGETPLMKGRTRVLVTHHVSACLPHSDYVAVLKDGRVSMSGSPLELQRLGHFANEILTQQDVQLSVIESPLASDDEEPQTVENSSNVNDTKTEDMYNSERSAEVAQRRGENPDGDLSELEGTLVDDEEREQGYVRPGVWLDYMRMCGPSWYWALILVFIFITRATSILQDYWVRLWMSSAGDGTSVVYWLGTYVMIGMLNTVVRLASMINENAGSMRAGRRYHESLFMRVMNASPRFFDKTPIGRVISRFSRDMRTIDDSILCYITFLFAQITQVGGVFVIISTVTPPFVFIAILMTGIYAMLAIYYLNATRELKRLDSISMSPLLSLFSELITGVESIRAFGAQNQYTMEAMNRIDTHNRPYYLMWAANRWLCARIEFSGCIVSFSTTILVLLSLDRIDAGLAGFVMMYAISFSDYMLWFIRNYSECEISMNSVERVNQYLKIEQEAPAFSEPQNRPPSSWPDRGAVSVKDLVIEYVPGTPVLHGITFSAHHGEKIGVVGRTGAGKSTLSLAFMRFIEATSGSIVVDDVDISKVGLEELRRNFTIIPQDPVLFNGTIRFNLDPFGEYPDELLWDSLKRSHLVHDDSAYTPAGSTLPSTSVSDVESDGEPGDRMAGIFSSLDADIKENGQNLSLGQRQLVALARALVRRSRLIIMDEATASVDFDTDNRIQRTIRGPEFANSTLFCIAHRLRTIIDYDRVLVLDKGRIAEFDTPWNLLQKEGDGLFKSMCEKSGEYEHLYSIAQAKRS
ncbi:hypothetical protein GGI07_002165 [Coemansia sp. Benny D115]|nr:hypothetical protein GGI07_002165 [Coemansia sp. Benny D115]